MREKREETDRPMETGVGCASVRQRFSHRTVDLGLFIRRLGTIGLVAAETP